MQLSTLQACKFSPSFSFCGSLVNLAELSLLMNPVHSSEARV